MRLRRKRASTIKICLIVALCIYISFELHKQTVSSLDDKYELQNASHSKDMSSRNDHRRRILPRISLQRKTRLTAVVGQNRATSRSNSEVVLAKRKNTASLKPQRVLIKRHVPFRHKRIAQRRLKKHGRISHRKTTKELTTLNRKTGTSRTWLSDIHVNIFNEWRETKATACGNDIESYPAGLISFRSSIFKKSFVSCQNRGGEDLRQVVGQSEEAEYCTVHKGFFVSPCKDGLTDFKKASLTKRHLEEWLDNLTPYAEHGITPGRVVEGFTIMVKRYEYVNIYHTMTDFYNAFLVMSFFHKSPNDTTIVFFDAHPRGSLDVVWKTLFANTVRVTQLPNITQFRHVVWGIPGYDSYLSEYETMESLPLFEEFRTFFLKRHDVTDTHSLDCKRGMRLVVIFRRDYVAHPRNPAGTVQRKIGNEDELLKVANRTGIFSSVVGIQLDKFSMRDQLQVISSADILAGMHGAGLTHAIFLPRHAGVIELFPSYFSRLSHFLNISKWRRLKYLRWQNVDERNEMEGKRTRIPPSLFRALLLEMKRRLCGRGAKHNKDTAQDEDS